AFARGFLDRIGITVLAFLRHGDALFAAAPVTRLQLRAVRDQMPAVAASPLLGRLTALEISGESTPHDLAALTASPTPTRLSTLALDSVDAAQARVLAKWQGLRRLRRLCLRNAYEAEAIGTLAASGRLANLPHLNLYGSRTDAASMEALADHLPSLTHLDLLGCA